MNTALVFLGVVIAAYAAILAALWRFQERIVFQPPTNALGDTEGAGRIEYRSRDGVDLAAYIVAPRGTPRGVVVAFHGNATVAPWLIPWARELSERFAMAVVLPEYRGYDGLSGVPTYEGSALDADAAIDAASRHFGVRPSELILYGHSLGTAIACEAASRTPARVLTLESPFSSARAMAARWKIAGLGLFWRMISRTHYDTIACVSRLTVPVHVVHGERDLVVPARMGRAVHAAARFQGRLLMVPRAGHNDVASVAGDAYWSWFEEAIREERQ